jgi:hypothetical protein
LVMVRMRVRFFQIGGDGMFGVDGLEVAFL